jgi:hypothetical protein
VFCTGSRDIPSAARKKRGKKKKDSKANGKSSKGGPPYPDGYVFDSDEDHEDLKDYRRGIERCLDVFLNVELHQIASNVLGGLLHAVLRVGGRLGALQRQCSTSRSLPVRAPSPLDPTLIPWKRPSFEHQ